MTHEIYIKNIEDLDRAAGEFLEQIGDNTLVALFAPMGSGKTTFTTAICRVLGVTDPVGSPTFAIVNEYMRADGDPMYHFDFYRTPNAYFKVTTDGMFVNVGSNIDSHTNLINGLRTDVNWLGGQNEEVHNLCSSLSVRADQIQSAVTGKIGASDVGTIVKQNATSWNLSINGKLKGTNYNFDGSNFTIGSSSGNTTAYHAAGYSKWVHSDGSYTRVDANGLTWSKGGTASKYHCLLYAGEYTCDSEATVTIQLPSEFIGKNFKVVTAVKRIYTSDSSHVTSAYFPLISFYAEALNLNKNAGTFQVYASIRAWNRTSYGGYGTIIGDGNWNEKQLVKPVVAYWAFV